jgi:uncharacterized phage-like protein YoqJ
MLQIFCGTGHRLQDLPCRFEFKHPWKIEKLNKLRTYLENNKDNIEAIISGLAIGWDSWLAWTAIKVGIPLIAYCPFEGQHIRWSQEHQEQFHWILEHSKHIEYVCESGYAAWKMQRRNEAMVNNSNLVLSLWNPEKKQGGTFNCIQYAIKKDKPILNFWSNPAQFITSI